MKLVSHSLLLAAVAALSACASRPAPKPAAIATTSAALTSADVRDREANTRSTASAAEQWAEKKAAGEAAEVLSAPREAGDPLAMNSELEESSIPRMDITPAKEVRAKSPAALSAAVGVVSSASSLEAAVEKLTQRLGKPSWTESPKSAENAKRRVWIAPAGVQCQRLILEADGTVQVETASTTEWRMLAASARQNPCTGEIKRGISGK